MEERKKLKLKNKPEQINLLVIQVRNRHIKGKTQRQTKKGRQIKLI